MGCDEFKQMLDAYIDGELSDAQMRMLGEHAKACDVCREELEAAKLLKDTLEHLDDDLAVPLQAQAAWRSAVRAEAAKQKKKIWMRYASAVAAVVVLAFGVNFALEGQTGSPDAAMQPMLTADSAEFAMVARDGLMENAEQADEQYTVRRKISVVSASEAMDKLSDLSQEYSGSFAAEGECACRIEIPVDYLEDFTKAAGRIGEEIYSETFGEAYGTAVVLIQISEK